MTWNIGDCDCDGDDVVVARSSEEEEEDDDAGTANGSDTTKSPGCTFINSKYDGNSIVFRNVLVDPDVVLVAGSVVVVVVVVVVSDTVVANADADADDDDGSGDRRWSTLPEIGTKA